MNDDHNTFDGVAHALAAGCPESGSSRAWRSRIASIRAAGRLLVVGHKEQAEHYWSQLKDHGLTMAPLDRV